MNPRIKRSQTIFAMRTVFRAPLGFLLAISALLLLSLQPLRISAQEVLIASWRFDPDAAINATERHPYVDPLNGVSEPALDGHIGHRYWPNSNYQAISNATTWAESVDRRQGFYMAFTVELNTPGIMIRLTRMTVAVTRTNDTAAVRGFGAFALVARDPNFSPFDRLAPNRFFVDTYVQTVPYTILDPSKAHPVYTTFEYTFPPDYMAIRRNDWYHFRWGPCLRVQDFECKKHEENRIDARFLSQRYYTTVSPRIPCCGWTPWWSPDTVAFDNFNYYGVISESFLPPSTEKANLIGVIRKSLDDHHANPLHDDLADSYDIGYDIGYPGGFQWRPKNIVRAVLISLLTRFYLQTSSTTSQTSSTTSQTQVCLLPH